MCNNNKNNENMIVEHSYVHNVAQIKDASGSLGLIHYEHKTVNRKCKCLNVHRPLLKTVER